MDVLEAIRSRRSIRKFKTDPIPDDLLIKILDAGRWAPSGSNIQPWLFIVVKDPKILKLVKMFSPGLFGDPPVVIAICSDKKRAFEVGGELARDYLTVTDCSMAAQNMMLAAHALGLGTCVIKSFSAQAIKKILKLPKHIEPELLLSIGYPDEQPSPPLRRPLEEITFLDEYGKPFIQRRVSSHEQCQ